MRSYSYKGQPVNEDVLYQKASSQGLTLDDYLSDPAVDIDVFDDGEDGDDPKNDGENYEQGTRISFKEKKKIKRTWNNYDPAIDGAPEFFTGNPLFKNSWYLEQYEKNFKKQKKKWDAYVRSEFKKDRNKEVIKSGGNVYHDGRGTVSAEQEKKNRQERANPENKDFLEWIGYTNDKGEYVMPKVGDDNKLLRQWYQNPNVPAGLKNEINTHKGKLTEKDIDNLQRLRKSWVKWGEDADKNSLNRTVSVEDKQTKIINDLKDIGVDLTVKGSYGVRGNRKAIIPVKLVDGNATWQSNMKGLTQGEKDMFAWVGSNNILGEFDRIRGNFDSDQLNFLDGTLVNSRELNKRKNTFDLRAIDRVFNNPEKKSALVDYFVGLGYNKDDVNWDDSTDFLDFYGRNFLDEDRMTMRIIDKDIVYQSQAIAGGLDSELLEIVIPSSGGVTSDSDFSSVRDSKGFVIDKRSQVIDMLRNGSLNFLFTEKEADARVFLEKVLPGAFNITEEVGGSNYIKVTDKNRFKSSGNIGLRYKDDDIAEITANANKLADYLEQSYIKAQSRAIYKDKDLGDLVDISKSYYNVEASNIDNLISAFDDFVSDVEPSDGVKMLLHGKAMNAFKNQENWNMDHTESGSAGLSINTNWTPYSVKRGNSRDYYQEARISINALYEKQGISPDSQPLQYEKDIKNSAIEAYKNDLVADAIMDEVDNWETGDWWEGGDIESGRRAESFFGGKLKDYRDILEAQLLQNKTNRSIIQQKEILNNNEDIVIFNGLAMTTEEFQNDYLIDNNGDPISYEEFSYQQGLLGNEVNVDIMSNTLEMYKQTVSFLDGTGNDFSDQLKEGDQYIENELGQKLPYFMFKASIIRQERFEDASVNITENLLNQQNHFDRIKKESPMTIAAIEEAAKNFNRLEEFGVTLGCASIDLARNLVYGSLRLSASLNPVYWVSKSFGYDPMAGIEAVNSSIANWTQREKDSYHFPVTKFKDIDGWGDSLDFMNELIAGNAPQVVVAVLTGGLGSTVSSSATISASIMGVSSSGQKFTDMDKERLNGIGISDAEYYLKGWGYGATEMVLGRLTMGQQIGQSWNLVRNGVKNEVYDAAVSSAGRRFLNNSTNYVKNAGIDGLGESLVYTGQLAIDMKLKDWQFIDAAEAFAAGSLIDAAAGPSITLGSKTYNSMFSPSYKGMLTSKFGNENITKNIQNNLSKQGKLSDEFVKVTADLAILKEGEAGSESTQGENVIVELEQKQKLIKTQLDVVSSEINKDIKTVENSLVEKGMRKKPAVMFANMNARQAKLRTEALNVSNNKQMTKNEKEQAMKTLNDEYTAINNFSNQFLDSETFGEQWFAMKGDALNNAETEVEVERIRKEAIEEIQLDKNNKSYKPTGEEIDVKAVDIVNKEAYRENRQKATEALEGTDYKAVNVDTKDQAIEQVDIAYDELINNANEEGAATLLAEKNKLIQKINSGRINGFKDPKTKLAFSIEEVALANGKTATDTHEHAHVVAEELMKNNPELFTGLSSAILDYLTDFAPDVLVNIENENANLRDSDGNIDTDELFASFAEEVAAENINIDDAKGIFTVIGAALNQGLKNGTSNNYEIDFKGANDISSFLKSYAEAYAANTEAELEFENAAQEEVELQLAANETVFSEDTRTKKELVEENKKLLAEKPEGFQDKMKENQEAIKKINEKVTDNEPASDAAKIAKKNINEAVDKVRDKIPEWKEGNRQKPNPVMDRLQSKLDSELDGMIKAKAERFVTNDKSVVDLTKNVDLKELQQAVKTELVADFRGFNKTNDSLYGYINARLKQRIGDVLPELWTDMSQKDIDNLGTSDTKTINETNETKSPITEVPNVNLQESLKDMSRETPMGKEVMATVNKVLKTKMPEFKYTRKNRDGKRTEVTLEEVKKVLETNPTGPEKRQAERDLAGIYKEFTNNLESTYASQLRDSFMKAFGSRKSYTEWLENNAPAISDLSIDKLVAFERLVKGEKIFTEVVKENLSVEDVKRFEGTGLLVSATTNQGPTLYKKLYPDAEAVKGFFDVKGSKKGTRKDALADKISGELALNATMEVAGNPDVMERFELGLKDSGTGDVIVAEYLQDLSSAIGRGLETKYSENLEGKLNDNNFNIYSNNLPEFLLGIKDVVQNTGLSNDSQTLRNQVRGVVEEYFPNVTQKAAIVNQFTTFLKPYAKQTNKYKNVKIDVETYLKDVIADDVVNSYSDFFNIKNGAEVIRNNNESQRAFSRLNAKEMLTLKDENGDLIYKNPLELAAIEWQYKGGLEDGSSNPSRAMTFYADGKGGHVKNFIDDYIAKVFSDESNPIVNVKNIGGTKANPTEQVEFEYANGEKVVVDTPRRATQQVTQDMIDNNMSEAEIQKREFDSNRAFQFVVNRYKAAKQLIDKGLATNENLFMMAAGMGANMKGPIRSAAMLRYLPVNPKYRNLKTPDGKKAYEYEHGIPAVIVNLLIADAVINGNTDIDLKELQDSYTVGVIDVDFNDNFGSFFKSRMKYDYKIGDLPTKRWYNEYTRGGEVHALYDMKDKVNVGEEDAKLWQDIKQSKEANVNELSNDVISFSETDSNRDIIDKTINVDKALNIARDPNAPVKKARVFDFDDTVARTNSKVFANRDGETKTLTAEEFAKQGEQLIDEGWTMDFSDFNKVVEGKKGPLFDVMKKMKDAAGDRDMFILTARAPESAPAIQTFLKEMGIDIPLENITGLGNSTGKAKADWLVNKASEGYNDFYFADDAVQNVKAVKDAMSVLDVKSQVQQAKIKFSENVGKVMDDIIFDKTGIEAYKEYSTMRAQAKGRSVKDFSLIASSAQDFGGLMYKLLAKGEKGDAQWEWMQENLIKPFSRGMNDLSVAQNQLMSDFRSLKNSLEGIPTNLKKQAFGGFTYEDITRIAAWDRQGIKVDGLSDRDLNSIRDFVVDNSEINTFVDQLINITKGEGYHYPGGDWLAGTITTDFMTGLRKDTRPKVLQQWNENIDAAFNEKTLNKLEAAFGRKYREAIEDSIRRMRTGQNRKQGTSKLEQRFQDYINNSVGAVMFLNARSAVLQTISAVNFVNWTDNNPLKAGKAFANQPQYWKDFMELMNSDFLVDRRNGLKINVSESEIAEAAKTTGNSVKGVISYLLNKGFVMTQFADSFAIASGGATFYRNRVNTYVKQGMSKADAEAKAFLEFRDTAEESQQSARADKISQQQASTLGRIVLAFANTPSQYARIMDKAGRDLVNGRGDAKSNISKIMYYGFVQNLMFTALQSALFATGFGDDDDNVSIEYFKGQGMSDEEAAKAMEYYETSGRKKNIKTANSMLDNILKGIGIKGQILATAKNTIIDLLERSEKEGSYPGPEYADNAWKLLEVSPPISIKTRKYKGGMQDYEMNSWRPEAKQPFNINNPSYRASAKVISAITNIPLDRLFQKVENIQGALDADNDTWQRVAMVLGWPKWQLENEVQRAERFAKEKEGRKQYRAEQKKKTTRQYTPKSLPTKEEYKAIELEKRSKTLFKLKKSEQIDSLRTLGLSTDAIKKLKYEKDRVNKIIELNDKE